MADKRILMPVKLIDASGSTTPNQLAIPVTGAAVANSTAGGILNFGSDGTNYHVVKTDTSGNLNVNATQSGTWTVGGGGTAGSAATAVLTVQGIASMTPLLVNGSGVTQPVSGTVTANAGTGTFAISASSLPLPTGAATSANQASLISAIGSTTSGQSGTLSMGATTTGSPTYTTAQTNPLSLTTAGALRVDASATTQPVSGTFWQATQPVSGTFWQTTQPVSGTVTANIGTSGSLALDASVGKLNVAQGAATGSNTGPMIQAVATTAAPSYTTATINPLSMDLAGNLRVNIVTGGSSGVVAQGSTTSGQTGMMIQGAVTTGSPTYTTADTNPLSLTTAGALRVDASATTQPVSGTVTANAGSGTFTVSGTVTANAGTGTLAISAASLPLPTGAATSANQASLITAIGATTSGTSGTTAMGAVTTSAPTYTTAQSNPLSLTTAGALRVDGSAVTQPVSGTVTANAGTGTMNVTGTGSAGTPASGIITVQGNASGTPIPVTGTFTDDLPVSPTNTTVTSAAVAAGSAGTISTATTLINNFLWGVDIACSVSWKAVINIISNNVTTGTVVLFGQSGQTMQWRPASRKFYGTGGTGTVNGYSVTITNQDTSDAADVYATFYTATS